MPAFREPTYAVDFERFPVLHPERKTPLRLIQQTFRCSGSMVDSKVLRKFLLDRSDIELRKNSSKKHRPDKRISNTLVLPRRVRWTTDFAYYTDTEGNTAVTYGHFVIHGNLIWVCAKRIAAAPADLRRGLGAKTRWAALERAGRACCVCGATAADGAKLQVDHIRPVSKGGTNELSNLQVLCQLCNVGKGAQYDGDPL